MTKHLSVPFFEFECPPVYDTCGTKSLDYLVDLHLYNWIIQNDEMV